MSAFALLFFTGLANASDFATLRSDEPAVIQLAVPPRDAGHDEKYADLKRRAGRKPGGEGQSAPQGVAEHVLFSHPLRKSITNSRPGFYAISNYVDQDFAAPDMLLDYECGERTYDLEDGTNHNGVDYFNFPFPWLSMQQDGVIAVAAADGMIIDKHDGEPDRNCALAESNDSNLVVLEHSDGSISIYAHLKRGSTTARDVGDMVEKGDYLGVVGSSGFSTGPHLHFGVLDSLGDLIEPHAGECNALNGDSWWKDQEDYYVPALNFIATHSDDPDFPPCPGVEQPNFENEFSAGDSAIFSIFVRDILMGEPVNLEIRNASGAQVLQWSYDFEEDPHAAAVTVWWGVDFSSNAPSGAYTFRVTYAGVTREHTFYIDAGPEPPPVATIFNNAYNGLWYDPALEGEGYNFVTADAGTVIYFYGSDQHGNRLWLISDLIPGNFGVGVDTEVTMFESTGGTFGSPVPSARGLSVWGNLTIEFAECDQAVATLVGVDGSKVSQLVKFAGAAGTACLSGDERPDSPWSGLWYDTDDDGEGYNLIVAPNGSILYYYGFRTDGKRLWLISDLVRDELQIGVAEEVALYQATQGTFDSPAPSSLLVQWGTATITLEDCGHITIVLVGNDGSKTSATVRLAGVIGIDCEA